MGGYMMIVMSTQGGDREVSADIVGNPASVD